MQIRTQCPNCGQEAVVRDARSVALGDFVKCPNCGKKYDASAQANEEVRKAEQSAAKAGSTLSKYDRVAERLERFGDERSAARFGRGYGIVFTVIGGAIAVWVFSRFTSLVGQLHTWSPPLDEYEILTLVGAGAAALLLIIGIVTWSGSDHRAAPAFARCPSCNSLITSGDRFCGQCGHELPQS